MPIQPWRIDRNSLTSTARSSKPQGCSNCQPGVMRGYQKSVRGSAGRVRWTLRLRTPDTRLPMAGRIPGRICFVPRAAARLNEAWSMVGRAASRHGVHWRTSISSNDSTSKDRWRRLACRSEANQDAISMRCSASEIVSGAIVALAWSERWAVDTGIRSDRSMSST